MTIDLWTLVAAVGLTWLLIIVAATPNLLASPAWSLGNREQA